MPGWHEKTKALQESGELQMVGIIEEQHPDRTQLFMQWKEMDWPLLIDSLNLLEVEAVPLTYLIDEHGIVRYERPSDEDLDAFLATTHREDVTERVSLDPEPGSAETLLLWGTDDALDGAIAKLLRRVQQVPDDPRAHFRLGVAYRRRYDSSERQDGDFAAAVEQWGRALAIDPNQYIFRRRIQQYGPRLDKPYPFYDWVHEARADITARGDVPVKLSVEPRGAEFAAPVETFLTAASPSEPPETDARVYRDDVPLIRVETTTVPTRLSAGNSARVHVVLRPDLSVKAHWNNEVDDLVFWVSPPEGWEVDERRHEVAIPPEPVSQEPRHVEFELRAPETFEGTATIPGYALYYVCEDVNGTCLYRRQDVDVVISSSE